MRFEIKPPQHCVAWHRSGGYFVYAGQVKGNWLADYSSLLDAAAAAEMTWRDRWAYVAIGDGGADSLRGPRLTREEWLSFRGIDMQNEMLELVGTL
jgi:hypothetical protein